MYSHLLEVFIPAQRGYRHPARKPNVARLTNLVTENSMVFEFRHDPDDLYEKLPIGRSSTLYIYNRSVFTKDMPVPDCVWPPEQTLWQRAMDMNYSHVQLRTLQALGFVQKENGDYYTKRLDSIRIRYLDSNEVRIQASAQGKLTYYVRPPFPGMAWRCLDDISPIDFDNIPSFVLNGE